MSVSKIPAVKIIVSLYGILDHLRWPEIPYRNNNVNYHINKNNKY